MIAHVFILWCLAAVQLGWATQPAVPLSPPPLSSFHSLAEQRRRSPAPTLVTASATSEFGPWIIQLRETYSHADFDIHLAQHLASRRRGVLATKEQEVGYDTATDTTAAAPMVTISHRYHHVYHGLVVHGMDLADVLSLPSVLSAVGDSIREIQEDLSWGQDRVDQPDLPLDGIYTPDFDGTGVDVYILDTGLDTNHIEFQGRSAPVTNVYDAYASSKTAPPLDNDHQGHGTHVTGTIGGKNVGIAKGAQLLGVRILNELGQGTVSDIIGALEFIIRHKQHDTPTVMSMSLGGPCQPSDCTQDPLIVAVQTLAKTGVIVSVAAGNSACNACTGSPNAAPDAITTGASTNTDDIAFFSNFGQCIDIFAPGFGIKSACAKVVCGQENKYWELSGTSMACPHVTGIIAQLLQRFPTASADDIAKYLTCDAARDHVHLDTRDTLSRNLLLQTPREETVYSDDYCRIGTGCVDECTAHGLCQALHPHIGASMSTKGREGATLDDNGDSHSSSLLTSPKTCHCDVGWYGDKCSATTDPMCPDSTRHNVKLSLYDAFGDGWSYSTYTISDLESGAVVAGAMDSMCGGSEFHQSYCLPDGCYNYEVSKGQFPGENEWKMCGIKGGTPYAGEFCMRAGHCLFQCPEGNFVDVTMEDTMGRGWGGAYYELYTPDGKQTFGGGLLTGEAAVHTLCLPKGCSYMMLQSTSSSSTNGDIQYDICGHKGTSKTVTEICIEDDGSCTTPDPLQGFICPITDTATTMYYFDHGGDGWGGAVYSLLSTETNQIMASGTLDDGFADSEPLCLPDGCYAFSVSPGSHDKDIFWNLCGHRGVAPFEAELCVEKKYNFCYGLSGCPALKSYLHHSDAQYYFVYHDREEGGGYDLDAAGDLHGVHELCGLSQSDGCHKLAVGSGKRVVPGDGDGRFAMCGHTGTLPSTGDVCMQAQEDGTNQCVPDMNDMRCPGAGERAHMMALADQAGDGWGGYYFEIKTERGKKLYKNSLSVGSFDAQELCLKDGCYELSFGGKGSEQDIEEIIWVMCGVVGPAVQSVQFCVTESGCDFILSDPDEGYYYYSGDGYYEASGDQTDGDDYVDDDFPVDFGATDFPTMRPTERVIGLPTISQRPSATPTSGPTSPHAPSLTQPPSLRPSQSPTQAPRTRPPTAMPTHPFGMLSVSLNVTGELEWDASTGADIWHLDYQFISQAVGRILEKSGEGVKLHSISAHVVAVRSFHDGDKDGMQRKLGGLGLGAGKLGLAHKQRNNYSNNKIIVQSVADLHMLKSSVFKESHIKLFKHSVVVNIDSGPLATPHVGTTARANERSLAAAARKPAFVTFHVKLLVSNSDALWDRDEWILKEAVDTAILLADVDGSLQRKVLRSLLDAKERDPQTASRVITWVNIVGVGTDHRTVPVFQDKHYTEKPHTIDFDDDDMFDDGTSGSGTEQGEGSGDTDVDTDAIIVRTNILVGIVTAVVTTVIVLVIAMMCIYRENGNKVRFTLESLLTSSRGRGDRDMGRGDEDHSMDTSMHSNTFKGGGGSVRNQSTPSNESLTVVFNEDYMSSTDV